MLTSCMVWLAPFFHSYKYISLGSRLPGALDCLERLLLACLLWRHDAPAVCANVIDRMTLSRRM